MKESDRDGARLTIRMPVELRDACERCAAADSRTVGGWVVLVLQRAVVAAGEARVAVVTRTPAKHSKRR